MSIFGFSFGQWKQIFLGLIHGVNFTKYADNMYSPNIMKELREGLEEGIDVTSYRGKRSSERIKLMKEAIRLKIDISKFMNNNKCGPDFEKNIIMVINAVKCGVNVNQLFENGFSLEQVLVICDAANNGIFVLPHIKVQMPSMLIAIIYRLIEANIDISALLELKDYDSFISDVKYNNYYKSVIKWYKNGFDVLVYIKRGFNLLQIEQIFLGWQLKIDTKKYEDVKFDYRKMEQIRIGEEIGIDTTTYAKCDFSVEQMKIIREALESGIDVGAWGNPEIDTDRMENIKKRLTEMKNNGITLASIEESSSKGEKESTKRNKRSNKYNI